MRAPSISCLRALRALATPELCRPFGPSAHLYSTKPPSPEPAKATQSRPVVAYKPPPHFSAVAPDEDPTPRPLAKPIGMPHPPQAGQNTGVDSRSMRQRRDDFVDYEKHLVRREKLSNQLYRPYFRDFTAMRHFKGKSFVANEKIFRKEHALWFPNLRGRTLDTAAGKTGEKNDTTDVLKGKVSVVSVFSSGWAENQVKTFCSEEANPPLHDILKKEQALAQMVEINVEDNMLKWWILRAFAYRLRGMKEQGDWGKYFMIRRGITDELREAVGLLNSKVGYVYLLDTDCKIRWAGSARAEEAEKESMISGLKRLIAEARHGKVASGGKIGEVVDDTAPQ